MSDQDVWFRCGRCKHVQPDSYDEGCDQCGAGNERLQEVSKPMTDKLEPFHPAFYIGAAEDRLKQAKAHLELAMQALKNEEALRAEVRAGRQFRRQVRDELQHLPIFYRDMLTDRLGLDHD